MISTHETLLSSGHLDPFNHGTTSLHYTDIDIPLIADITENMRTGWGVRGVLSVSRIFEGAEKPSNNFRVLTVDGNTFLYKTGHLNQTGVQNAIHETLVYLAQQGTPVPHIYAARDDKSYRVSANGQIICLHEFIDGEHYDGSLIELKEEAKQLALLHRTLQRLPDQKTLQDHLMPKFPHDKQTLAQLIGRVRANPVLDDFDEYVLKTLTIVEASSQGIDQSALRDLPSQVIHYDIHPHNLLFDPKTNQLLAFIDFDTMCFSSRIMDVALAMHRAARTFGVNTERNNDIGGNMRSRARLFLSTYEYFNPLTALEIRNIATILQDRSLGQIQYILYNHYVRGDPKWSFDLQKQITLMQEAQALALVFS